MRLTHLALALALGAVGALPAHANLDFPDPKVLAKHLAQAEELYTKRDVDGLLRLLKESHLFAKQEVALKLGRLGADRALPVLREHDQRFSRFACAPSGEFGVAVILIENKTKDAQKKALLAVATEPREKAKHARSVVDAAGRELGRYRGDDIVTALADVYTYGAQHTVLEARCRKLSRSDAIALCIAVLEAHETPLKAQAAERILAVFGSHARTEIEKLSARVKKRIKPTDPNFTKAKTIGSRCRRLLKLIRRKEKAAKPDAGGG